MSKLKVSKTAPHWVPRAFQVMEHRGILKQALFEVFNRSQVTVDSYLAGRLEPSYRQLIDLASFLKISMDDLLGDDDIELPDPSIPIRDMLSLRAMNDPLVDEDLLGREPTAEELDALVGQVNNPSDPEDAERIVPPVAVSDQGFGVRVRGREAEPEFGDGDVVVIDPQRGDFRNGDFVLFQASEQALPEIRLLIKGNRSVLYPVVGGTPALPIEVPKDTWFLERILAKAKIYASPESANDRDIR